MTKSQPLPRASNHSQPSSQASRSPGLYLPGPRFLIAPAVKLSKPKGSFFYKALIFHLQGAKSFDVGSFQRVSREWGLNWDGTQSRGLQEVDPVNSENVFSLQWGQGVWGKWGEGSANIIIGYHGPFWKSHVIINFFFFLKASKLVFKNQIIIVTLVSYFA